MISPWMLNYDIKIHRIQIFSTKFHKLNWEFIIVKQKRKIKKKKTIKTHLFQIRMMTKINNNTLPQLNMDKHP